MKVKTLKKSKNPFVLLIRDIKKQPAMYLMILPVVIYYILFHYKPMYGLLMAFQDYSPRLGISGSEWVGFRHFKTFFNDIYFFNVLKNTLVISFSSLIFGFPMPIIFALLLNEVRSKFYAKTIQTVSYMPYFISLVVICGMIKAFTADDGLITQLLLKIGIDTGTMLAKSKYFVPIYVISGIWQGTGWDAIIYLAAISAIDQQLYEAAKIDGAGKVKQLIHVTIPSILPTIVILLIMRIGSLMSVGTDKILLLYNDGILETADTIGTYIYRKGLLDFNWSYSAAVGMFNSVINVILLVTANAVSRKLTESSLW